MCRTMFCIKCGVFGCVFGRSECLCKAATASVGSGVICLEGFGDDGVLQLWVRCIHSMCFVHNRAMQSSCCLTSSPLKYHTQAFKGRRLFRGTGAATTHRFDCKCLEPKLLWAQQGQSHQPDICLLYTSPSPRD